MIANPDALNVVINGETTLREYFKAILLKVWEDTERFSGKRPLGRSGWATDVAAALIQGGFVQGEISEDEGIINHDWEAIDNYVSELIKNHLFNRLPSN